MSNPSPCLGVTLLEGALGKRDSKAQGTSQGIPCTGDGSNLEHDTMGFMMNLLLKKNELL